MFRYTPALRLPEFFQWTLKNIDETDFEQSILRHLRASDAVLLVISEHTFTDRIHRDSDWVRREIREALEHDKPLFLVCVEGLLPPPGLPDDIKRVARMQGTNFYPEYFTSAVERLTEFIVKVGVAQRRARPAARAPQPRTVPELPETEAIPVDEKRIQGRATLDEALDLLEAGNFDKALFLLESLQKAGYRSRYVRIDSVLEQARKDAEKAQRRRQAALDYDEIAAFARRKMTEAHAREAFQAWSADYAELVEELDSENLRERFRQQQQQSRARIARPALPSVTDLLPRPFAWCDIPAGRVEIEDHGGFDVAAFKMAKYPITNAQYQVFVDAENGYRDAAWWEFSDHAIAWRAENAQPRDTGFEGDDLPRTNVCWYEAVAFCRWLSAQTGEDVTLPTEQQWQRAAQGDDGRAYPWGNEKPNERLCNFGGNVDQTTPVTRYPDGASPYGVMDMAGNVWEWCLNPYEDPRSVELVGDAARVVRGGSWFVAGIDARAVIRRGRLPFSRDDDWGFRVVCARPMQ